MAQALFEALAAGVTNVDNQTAMAIQNLLDQQPPVNEASQQDADEEDVFQCGKCKKQFTSLSSFLAHKNQQCMTLNQINVVHSSPTNENVPSGYVTTATLNGSHLHGTPLPMYSAVHVSPLSHLNQGVVIGDDLMSLSGIDHSLTPVTMATHMPHTPVSAPTNFASLSMATQLTPISVSANLLSPPHASNMQPHSQAHSVTIFGPVMSQPAGINVIQMPQQIPLTPIDKLPILANLVKPAMTKADRKSAQASQQNGLLCGDVAMDIGGKKKLVCQYCQKVFTKNFDLQQHVRSHTGERPFQCIVCGRAFAQKSNVKKHMATHKVWPSGNCTLPKQGEGEITDEKMPTVESQDGTSSLQATREMSIGTTTDEGGQKHVVVDNSYLCQYCHTKFRTYYQLKSHMVTHKANQVYKCVLRTCGRTFKDLDTYLTHTKTHERVMTYRCHICNLNFANLYDLGVHQISHSLYPADSNSKPGGYRQYVCTKCQSKYANPEALEHHMATSNHHFPCTYCQKVFTCERLLRRHLPIHGTTPRYQCEECKKEFKTENYLKMHMICHSTEKPFACDICSAAFNRRDKLKRHLLIHDAVKRFKCPFKTLTGCSKEFNRQDKLKAHIIIHSGIKPFVCKLCGHAFVRANLLAEHERMHRADYDYRCGKCGKGFFKEKLFVNHKCRLKKDGTSRVYRPRNKRKIGRPRKRMITVLEERGAAKKKGIGRPRKTCARGEDDIVTVEVNIERMPENCGTVGDKGGPVIVVDGNHATVVNGSSHFDARLGRKSDAATINATTTDETARDTTAEVHDGFAGMDPDDHGANETPVMGEYIMNKPMDIFNSPQAYIVNLNELTLGDDGESLLSEPASRIISSSISQVLAMNGSPMYPTFILDGRGSVVSVIDSNGTTIPAQVVLTSSDADSHQYMEQMGDFVNTDMS